MIWNCMGKHIFISGLWRDSAFAAFCVHHPHMPGVSWGHCCWSRQYSTPGTSLSKTPLLTSANETAHKEGGQPPVVWYNFWWFQPHSARVTCNVYDANGSSCWDSHHSCIRLQFWGWYLCCSHGWRLAKSIGIIFYFHSAHFRGLWRCSARVL